MEFIILGFLVIAVAGAYELFAGIRQHLEAPPGDPQELQTVYDQYPRLPLLVWRYGNLLRIEHRRGGLPFQLPMMEPGTIYLFNDGICWRYEGDDKPRIDSILFHQTAADQALKVFPDLIPENHSPPIEE